MFISATYFSALPFLGRLNSQMPSMCPLDSSQKVPWVSLFAHESTELLRLLLLLLLLLLVLLVLLLLLLTLLFLLILPLLVLALVNVSPRTNRV